MIEDVECLSEKCIVGLVRKSVLAIKIKEFIPKELALKIGSKILRSGFESYQNAPSIGKIGTAFYETERDLLRIDDYFGSASENIDVLRHRCSPYLSPIDLLRCVFDEVWPAGANLETLYGRKMYVGLSRVIQPGICFLAHHDIFSKDAPDSFKANSLQAQLSCNIYLNMPSQGGALQVWRDEVSPDEFDKMRGESYGIHPDVLGAPDVEICPEPGDLVLSNSRCMHSVTPGTDDLRLSLSCFVGYRGFSQPLSFWS